MNPTPTQALQHVLQAQRVAALGTLHDGAPYVSMVPFAVLPGGDFVIHVSHLSSHTKDMLQHPRVSLLIVAPDDPGTPAQALPRVTIQGQAEPCAASVSGSAAPREAYLARFPDAAEMLDIPGFSFFSIRPVSVRVIAGFAQATTLTPESFTTALTGA